MKVFHIIDSGGLYGAEVMLLNLVKEQQNAGMYPVIGSIGDVGLAEKPLEVAAVKAGLPVQPFRMRPGFNVLGVKKILAYCHSQGFHLIHSHGYKGNILFGFLPKRIRKIPIVSTIHGWTSTAWFTKMYMYEWMDGKSLGFLDAVIVVNKNMMQHPRLRRISSDKLHVVENGIPNKTIYYTNIDQDIVNFCQEGIIVGSVGRYSLEKGFSVLLQAIQILSRRRPDIRLLLIGEGHLRKELTAQALSLGIKDRIFFTGYRENAAAYMKLMDVYVISSFTEGLPITLLESMKAKIPIVATTVGGIPDVLEHEKDALLVPPKNVDKLANAIERTLKEPKDAGTRSDAAFQKFIHKYSSEKMAIAYSAIYRQVCNSL